VGCQKLHGDGAHLRYIIDLFPAVKEVIISGKGDTVWAVAVGD
jgi:hypothetical protein